jgi:glycosyltransferase involved in cell wall biosynthesis
MNLYINLTNFKDNRLGGVGFFMKRIFEKLNQKEEFFNLFTKIYIFYPSNVAINELLSIPYTDKLVYKKINYISSNIIFRIFFEQFLLPFYFKNEKSIYFSPNPVIPVFLNSNNVYKICTIHDLIPFKIKKKYGFLRTLYIKSITKLSAKFSNKIITVSQHSKKDIIDILSISPKKIEIIYNFINFPISNLIEKKEDYIVSICTIEPGKNIESMLFGFKELVSNNIDFKNYKYYIVGKPGWNFQNIYNLAEKLNLDKNIIFTGYLSDDDKFQLLKKSKCLLFLSKYEGFGIPILEALYCNTPCLILNNSSLPEVMGTSGLIINSDDSFEIAKALKIILSNPNNFLSNRANEISRFNADLQISNFIKIFKNLI